MTATISIPEIEKRYPDRARWGWNNGFRRRWLALGDRNAAAINAARRGDLAAVLAHAAALGGLTQRLTWARSAIAAAKKLPADVNGHRVVVERGQAVVATPALTWEFRGDRQVAKISWTPMWGVKIAH